MSRILESPARLAQLVVRALAATGLHILGPMYRALILVFVPVYSVAVSVVHPVYRLALPILAPLYTIALPVLRPLHRVASRILRYWPRIVTLVLALVPVCAILFVLVTVVMESMPAFSLPGLSELFSTTFVTSAAQGYATEVQYGLTPAIWGTLVIVVTAVAVGLPISFSIAVLSSELSLGPLSRFLRTVVLTFAGIPPILYGLAGGFFAALFFAPLFGAGDFPFGGRSLPGWDVNWPPAQEPTLLAGLLVGLLITPFMTPLIEDALRSVPANLKEGSLALGANRWHTLVRVTLPSAMPGIVGAATLGTLKAVGDVMIAFLVVGWLGNLPSPLWDVWEAAPPLTSVGAGLLGGTGQKAPLPIEQSVGYFCGLLLLVMTFFIVGVMTLLQAILRRRLTA